MDIQQFNDFLRIGLEDNYTDITMQADFQPMFGYCDKYWYWPGKPISREDLVMISGYLIDTKGRGRWKREEQDEFVEQDISYELIEENKVIGRFRISLYTSMGDPCLSIRVIPTRPLDYSQLNLPKVITKLAQLQRGLILVTGATGQGKSTTISCFINEINKTRVAKIITIEDPVEFTYQKGKSFLMHREVGLDVPNYQVGIRQGLRQRPNVIMVGEIRDRVTLDAVMLAAQTGHLVISSIHTTDARTTLNEIMSYYAEDKEFGFNRLANNLVAILSQRLLPTKENTNVPDRNILGKKAKVSVVPACEVLYMTETVKELLKKQELDKLATIMEKDDGYYGMQTFDQDIFRLYNDNKITKEVACNAASKKEVIERSETLEGKNLPVIEHRKLK